MYSFSASASDLPFKAFQASHLYLPLRSKTPGLAIWQQQINKKHYNGRIYQSDRKLTGVAVTNGSLLEKTVKLEEVIAGGLGLQFLNFVSSFFEFL
jgi:hypothetical protein